MFKYTNSNSIGPQTVFVSFTVDETRLFQANTSAISMLEEPEYRNVVRWTESGDSFVVIDVSYMLFHRAWRSFTLTQT